MVVAEEDLFDIVSVSKQHLRFSLDDTILSASVPVSIVSDEYSQGRSSNTLAELNGLDARWGVVGMAAPSNML